MLAHRVVVDMRTVIGDQVHHWQLAVLHLNSKSARASKRLINECTDANHRERERERERAYAFRNKDMKRIRETLHQNSFELTWKLSSSFSSELMP